MSGCANVIPAIQVSTGSSGQLNNVSIEASFGFIRYDTTNHNLEVYEENGWKDIVINDKPAIDISGKLVVDGDVSFNAHLSAVDASFQNNVDISGNLIVAHGEVSFNKLLKVPDASFNNIGNLNGSSLQINTDVSFISNVNIIGNLTIDGSFSFNEVIQNITTISNEILISTQLDICNQGTGPALEVTQIGTGETNDVALFNSDPDDKAFEIKHDGKSIFYKDVSFHTKLIVPDASFNNIGSLDDKELQIVTDASFQNNVDISGTITANHLTINSGMITFPDGTSQTTAATTADPVTDVSYSGDTLTLTRAEGSDLTTTIATSDPTKIENGNSSMRIASANGDCVFTPNGDAALTTTFAADGTITTAKNIAAGKDTETTSFFGKSLVGSWSNSGGNALVDYAIFSHHDRQNEKDFAVMAAAGGTTYLNAKEGSVIRFRIDNTNKMILDANGNFGINDLAPAGGKLCVQGGIYVDGADGIIIPRDGTYDTPGARQYTIKSEDSGSLEFFYASSTASHPQGITMTLRNDGTLQIKGNIQEGSSGSDDRLKKDKAILQNATESIGKLSVQTYKKENINDFSLLKRTGVFVSETGLIAQEVYYNAPEFRHLVSTGTIYDDDSGLHDKIVPNEMDLTGVPIGEDPDYEGNGWSKEQAASINYQGFISYLIKSNQELAERLAALENK